MTVSASQDAITLPADGAYHVEAALLLVGFEDDAEVQIEASIQFGDVVRTTDTLPINSDGVAEITASVSGVLQGADGDAVQLGFLNSSNQSMTVEGGTFESYLAVTQL